jgi:uncharacterized protein (TIGR02996 family)
MSPDEFPFLDAILTRPADDGPRLVYADFLADTGSPADAARSDLIRVQVALARMPDDHPRRPDLVERQTDLVQSNKGEWAAHLRGLVDPDGVEFRRGLPDSVAVDAGVFAARGDDLFARTRTPSGRSYLRRVFLKDAVGVLPKLVACPALGQVEELSLAWGDLGNAGVNLLARCPFLVNLHGLDLSSNRLDDAGVRFLAASARFPRLERLALNDNEQITWDGVTALAESPFFAGLTDLDLGRNDVNDAGVRALVGSRSLTRLSGLNLTENLIGDAGVAALVGSPLFRRMLARDGRIDLRRNMVGAAGAEALAASPDLGRATVLDLENNYLGDRGAVAIATAPGARNLKRLRLARNQITDAGAFALADAITRALPALQSINLSGNRLTRRGADSVRDAAFARGVIPDVTGNTADSHTHVPIPMADVLPGVMADLMPPDAGNVDELRRRVTFPARPPQ